MIKQFLHTKIGARVGFALGISGFNRVEVKKNGKTVARAFNSRTNKGAALMASLFSGSSLGSITTPLPPLYIALSTSVLTPASGDTTLTGETSSSGLARALGTAGSYSAPGALDGAASYTIAHSFTCGVTGPITINSLGLFDAVSGGNLCAEVNLGAASTLVLNDVIAPTWTINI